MEVAAVEVAAETMPQVQTADGTEHPTLLLQTPTLLLYPIPSSSTPTLLLNPPTLLFYTPQIFVLYFPITKIICNTYKDFLSFFLLLSPLFRNLHKYNSSHKQGELVLYVISIIFDVLT